MTMYQAIKFTCRVKLQPLSPAFPCRDLGNPCWRRGRSVAVWWLLEAALRQGCLRLFGPPHRRSLDFTIGLTLFEVFALVVLGFAFAHR